MSGFTAAGTPLTANGVAMAANRAGTGIPELWAVISVETSGCGFLPDRRPKILFERHIFHRLTDGRYDAQAPDISQPSAGGYGAPGAHQYDRLAAARQLDEAAALQSASWGLGQVLGNNFTPAGFPDVAGMVAAIVASEDGQLLAMAAFVANSGMAPALSQHDWAAFARGYNGLDYAANNYDGLLQHFYGLYTPGPTPDLQVRAAQMYLTYRGFAPGSIDGVAGPRTAAAVRAFQATAGIAQTGQIDDALLSRLGAG
ncbi:MAG TPA: N-acetylmuramidase domain-containing protein [Acetobacteraceae bacterium]|nr:N-acetylmuramidase domain-containing protein [Acetobacteraceae bacterium]